MGGKGPKKPSQPNQNSNKATKQKPTKSLIDILRIKFKESSNSVVGPEMSWAPVLAQADGEWFRVRLEQMAMWSWLQE